MKATASRQLCPYIILVLLIATSSFSVASAAIHDHKIDTVEKSFVLVDGFWFKETQAHLQLNITDLTFSDPNPNSLNLSQIGFFLSRNNRSTLATEDINCYLHSPKSSKLLYTLNNTNTTKIDLHFTDIDGEAYYLYFENCITDKLNVSLTARSSMYNLDPTTGKICYLSFEKSNFQMIYSLYLVSYTSLAFFWSYFLIYKKSKGCVVYRIHVVMVAVVFLKTLSIFLELSKEVYILHTGCAQCLTYIISNYTAIILGGTPFVILMVLIFTGWSFAKPCLRYWDLALLVLIVVGKVLLGVSWITLESVGCHFCSGLMAFVDVCFNGSVGYLSLLSVTTFLYDARKAHGKATPVLKKLTQFRVTFLVYIFFSIYNAVVVFWFETFSETPKDMWKSLLLKEMGEVFLYMFIGYWFRPQVCTSRILIADDVENAACKLLDTDYDNFLLYINGFQNNLSDKSKDVL